MGNITGSAAISKAFGVSGVPGVSGLSKTKACWVGVLGVAGADNVRVGLKRSSWSVSLIFSPVSCSCCTLSTNFSTSVSEFDGEIPLAI